MKLNLVAECWGANKMGVRQKRADPASWGSHTGPRPGPGAHYYMHVHKNNSSLTVEFYLIKVIADIWEQGNNKVRRGEEWVIRQADRL